MVCNDPACASTSAQSLASGHIGAARCWWKKRKANQNKAEISLSLPVGLVRSSVSGSQIHKARVNTSGWASFAPVRRKPRSPLNRYMLLFFLHKMAAVLSAAWQPSGCVCVHGGTRRLCPSSFPLCTPARLAVLFLFRHPVVLVTGDEPCGLKKQTGLP